MTDSIATTPTPAPGIGARLAGQRLQLQLVAAALAQPLEPRAVAAHVLEAACVVLDAPLGSVVGVTPDGSEVEMLQSRGYAHMALEPWARIPLELRVPLTEVIRTGRPILHESAAERHREFPAILEHSGTPTEAEGSAVVPLVFEGRSIGALAISFREPRHLDDDERWFLESLAAQASQALERARLFAEISERDLRLQLALEASDTGTWEWDPEPDRLIWSPEVFRLHGMAAGMAPAGLEGWLAHVHPDDRGQVRQHAREAARDEHPYRLEFRPLLPDGAVRWVYVAGRMAPQVEGHGPRMLGTIRDVTDRRLAEAERDRMLEAERAAARLREAFISVVSHELRTPITTIYGGTLVLARRWRDMDPATRDGMLDDVAVEAERLYRLVEDLLVLTRVERGTLDLGDEPIHLGRLLERVVASERSRWPEVAFRVLVPPGLPSIAGEETYVEQLLRNLLSNAAKYGGPGSTVTATATAEAATLVLRVTDEGPGIEPSEADRVFDLFYRAPATAGKVAGAGIGLFVCRQLVNAMGGSIHVERAAEGGAEFVVALPVYLDDDT